MSETRMKLRSSITPEERETAKKEKERQEQERLHRPFIDYNGKIKYCTNFVDCAMACDEIIKMVETCIDEFLPIGFDIEWPFSFQTGPGKAAVVQISPNLDVCYVLQISELKNVPKAFNVLLSHDKTRITGVNIKNDIRKLARDFSGFDSEKIIANCIDCGVFANQVLPVTQRWSMAALVGYVLKMKINKDNSVRMSKWHISPLSEAQLKYAAIDAYASLLLYKELVKKQGESSATD